MSGMYSECNLEVEVTYIRCTYHLGGRDHEDINIWI